MGFLPKHIKRERERKRLRIIALAVLHGFVAIKHRRGMRMSDRTPPWASTTWEVRWPESRWPGHFHGRSRPAAMYLEEYVHGKH